MELLNRRVGESGQAYALRVLKENIINLSLEPGSQISENELAVEMGLSRTPVRGAISDLSKLRIIEIYPQKKGVVSLIDYDVIDECQFMRLHLEKAVMEIVCRTAVPEDIDRLRDTVDQLQRQLEGGNTRALLETDKRFHGILFEIAGKPLLYRLMNTLSIHFDRLERLELSSARDPDFVRDHEQIVAAIGEQDAERACAILELHFNRYKADAPGIREKYPQYIK